MAAEREVLERRREHLIIRVDRADLSKNVLRGFTAFDTFLQQHPEFREKVTFIAHLQPSRQDVPEYAEYLERIEALVAVVNHRHGTTDWMPIDLKIYENFPEAVARYKHFDLLMVNSIFDGMNLVAKEAPAVNTRNGVLMLSENTGSHEELADCALSVNPFDIQEQADAIYRALTMDPEERRVRAQHLKEIIYSRNPGDWVDAQLHDIEELRETRLAVRGRGLESAGALGVDGRSHPLAACGKDLRGDRSPPSGRCSSSRPAAAARPSAPASRRRPDRSARPGPPSQPKPAPGRRRPSDASAPSRIGARDAPASSRPLWQESSRAGGAGAGVSRGAKSSEGKAMPTHRIGPLPEEERSASGAPNPGARPRPPRPLSLNP